MRLNQGHVQLPQACCLVSCEAVFVFVFVRPQVPQDKQARLKDCCQPILRVPFAEAWLSALDAFIVSLLFA
jgi:hypothetical protein